MDLSETQCAIAPALEEWRAVPGYEGRYEVSDQGNVRSLRSGKLLAAYPSNYGYLLVRLSNGTGKTHAVHALVAKAFLGARNGKLVDHANRSKTDNRLSNLRYATYSESNRNRVFLTKNQTESQTPYIGVVCKTSFSASIKSGDGRIVYLGTFRSAKEAAIVRDKAARELHGSFAILNFPEDCQ